MESQEDRPDEERVEKSVVITTIRDIAIALLLVALLVGCVFAYTRVWPPLVVIESESMSHSDESQIGVIDTGDLVLVQKVTKRSDIVTYVEGEAKGHSTYGEHGDVIVYYKNGYEDETPVIHRAIVWIEYNETSSSYDIPSMGLYSINTSFTIPDVGYDHLAVTIDVRLMLNHFDAIHAVSHSGFITLGDHNRDRWDQQWMGVHGTERVEPVKVEWILGKASGELPWFGAVKLYLTHNDGKVPENTWTNLKISLALIIGIPIAIDVFGYIYEKKGWNWFSRLRRKKSKKDETGAKGSPEGPASPSETGGTTGETPSGQAPSAQEGAQPPVGDQDVDQGAGGAK